MKQFFSTTLAATLGVLIAGVLILFIGMAMLVGSLTATMASSSEVYELKSNTLLHLKLQGAIPERTEEDPFAKLFQPDMPEVTGLENLISAIQYASESDDITAIYLEPMGVGGGYATLDALRSELVKFKESGKPIIAYGDLYTQSDYYLASVADTVVMNPVGMLDFRGLSVNPVFYTKALEKLGVEMQIFKVGTYKSAVEPYMLTEMSEPSRRQTQEFLDNIWGHLLNGIGESRNLSSDQLNSCANEMMMTQAAEKGVEYGLLDTLMYKTEVNEMLCRIMDEEKIDDVRVATPNQLLSIPNETEKVSDNEIAVIYAVGTIDGTDPNSGINTKKLVKELTKVTEDEGVKGVVLRVNSPGGSAFGSEQVWKAMVDLKAKKPVAVSMGDYAASGGYYISCPADQIFAHATTLTGSIGIFGQVPNANDLLTQKIGLSFDEVRTNKYGAFPSLTSPMTPDEKALMQGYIERGYSLFLSRCAEGRGMTAEAIGAIAEGRVWSGDIAQELNLVDQIGSLEDAVSWVAKDLEVEDDYTVVEYPKKKTFFETLIEEMSNQGSLAMAKAILGSDFVYYNTIKELREGDPIQAKMELIEIK